MSPSCRFSALIAVAYTALGFIFPSATNAWTIENEFSPGNSPGCIQADNITFSNTSTLLIEIGGSQACSEFDRFLIAEMLTINGATLKIKLINGYLPTASGISFDILDFASLTGAFNAIDTSEATLALGLNWDFSTLYTSGEISIVGVEEVTTVPIPTFFLFAFCAAVIINSVALLRTFRL